MKDGQYYIVEAEYRGGHRVFLRFADGSEGEIDLGPLMDYRGLFAPLADEREFARLRFDPDEGTIVWPNGADLAPDTLYEYVTGTELEWHEHTPEERARIRGARQRR